MKKVITHISYFVTSIILIGCVEPYPIATNSYEELLVVDATLTDSLQYQTVKLTKSYPLTTESATYVNNATVWIEDTDGQIFNFSQIETDSTYISDVQFNAQQNNSYSLHITTSNGNEYTSEWQNTPPQIQINDLYAEHAFNEEGTEGAQVYIDVKSDDTTPIYLRYTYEETHKIRTPRVSSFEWEIQNYVSPVFYGPDCITVEYDIILTERDAPVNICYKTNYSNNINLANSNNLSQNIIDKHPIRFINKDDYILAERYSILATVYSESYQSYQYYQTLDKLNSNGSVLSPVQTGHIQGNIFNNNSEEKIIGNFNVTAVKTKRIFFDFTDFGFSQPSYPVEQDIHELDYMDACNPFKQPDRLVLRTLLLLENYQVLQYQQEVTNFEILGKIYTVINPECADCTTFASNVKPAFWED
ncbi:DUF4249 domain-containing protein [Neptunitalea lumnitzerae]|uniref:DUF4249 domain-containing protein n=1 Tax=Neptunitalea lumnitzerae TaxID=2965509 RepID=A0ABQ5MNI0_9FLAO|nr:DUF4249 domain-containing protein [Neptunitalea sp. Y10]GLB50957.1 hypothetical protein Y10_33250 [Neptunitalea sp. Y10]